MTAERNAPGIIEQGEGGFVATNAARRRRVRPEQRQTFVLTLRPEPGAAGIRALRWLLKVLLRKHKLRCISIEERGQL
jgi:hypothetical protein